MMEKGLKNNYKPMHGANIYPLFHILFNENFAPHQIVYPLVKSLTDTAYLLYYFENT